MGLYDTVEVIYPLPEDHNSLLFQTKDLGCSMDHYTITAYGRLILHYVEFEAVPEEERPYKDDPNALLRLCGSIRVRPGSEHDVDRNYHGYMRFYDCKGKPGEPGWEWIEYEAKFSDGRMVAIERVTFDEG